MMKNLLTGTSEVQADLVRVSFICDLSVWCRKEFKVSHERVVDIQQ